MERILFTLGLLTVLLFSYCGEPNEDETVVSDGTLSLQVKGNYGADDLAMYANDYTYADGMNVRFQLFQFYISDIRLIRSASQTEDTELVDEVALVTFKDIQSAADAANSLSVLKREIPAGVYEGIQFNVGLDENLNSTQPGDYDVNHPLSGHYWSAALGYVFAKIEGNADLNGDGDFADDGNDGKLTYHIGTADMLRKKTILQPFEVKAGEELSIDLSIDLKAVLIKATDNFLDFRQTPIDHGGNPTIGNFIMDNLTESLVVQ